MLDNYGNFILDGYRQKILDSFSGDDRVAAREYLHRAFCATLDCTQLFVEACRLFVNGKHEVDQDNVSALDCAVKFLEMSNHQVKEGKIAWEWRDCDKGAIDFDILEESAQSFARHFDRCDWSVIVGGCYAETAVTWALEGASDTAFAYAVAGICCPQMVAEIEASELSDILTVEEIGERRSEIEEYGVHEVERRVKGLSRPNSWDIWR